MLKFLSKIKDYFLGLEFKYLVLILGILILSIISIILIVMISKHSKKTRAELRELDYLTKIYNRYYYYKKSKLFLSGTSSKYAIIAFDINKFKLINEYYGTEEADKLLKEISEKLIEFYVNGQIQIFGRIESDKFSWIMQADKDKINKVFKSLDIVRQNSKHSISFNLGVYFIEDNNMDVEQAYSRANIAAKSIKGNFDKSIAYFDSHMINQMKKEQFIINNIDKAMKNNEIKVYFQPKYDLQEDIISGAEALVRWIHPERGMISPQEFIPALENNGLITKLDKYIWEKTASYLAKWRSEGLNPVPVSINISKVDLLEVDLPEFIESLVRKYSIPHNLFELEITESACVDGQIDVTSILKKFKSKGFIILMDDFGSGYSSLNTLRQFPIDVLKIDLKFLSGFDDSNETVKGKTIIESIVTMAKHLHLEIVVEGTENINQVEYCKSIGCEVAQGYYFSKPISAEDFILLVKEGRKKIPNATFSSRLTEDTVWSKSILTEDFFNSTNSALGVFIYRRDRLEAVRLNEKYFEIIGTTRKDFYARNKNVLEDVYREDYDLVLDNLFKCVKSKSSVDFEYRRLDDKGNIKWIRIKLTYVNNDDPSINYFFAALDDITKEKEAILEVSEIINSLDYGIIKCDMSSNKILLYNDTLLKMLNLSNDEFDRDYKENYYKLISEDDIDYFINEIKEINDNSKKVVKCNFNKKLGIIPVINTLKVVKESGKKYLYFNVLSIL